MPKNAPCCTLDFKKYSAANSAGTLMSYLPATTELATAQDLRDMGSNIEVLFGRLDERMDRLEQRMDRFEETMIRFEETMIRFDDRLHEFNGALRDHTRNILFYSVAVTFSMVAGAIALASLL